MKHVVTTLALCATVMLGTSAASAKSTLKLFQFGNGYIKFYTDFTYKAQKGANPAKTGKWKWLEVNKIPCPTTYRERHCRKFYKIK